MSTITLGSDQIWLKGKDTVGQVWTPTLSSLPAGATVNKVTLSFVSSNVYASPGRTEVFWGTSAVSANRLWYVSQSSGGGNTTTIDLTGRITGNGSFSLYFRKTANSAGTQSNVVFSAIAIAIDYTDPVSNFTLDKGELDAGQALGVSISRVNSSYTHRVTYRFGSHSYTASNVATSTSYTIPVSWLDAIPSAVSGTGTVTVETLNSAGSSMGSVSRNVTIRAGAGIVPTVGTVAAALKDGLGGAYIQNHSSCKVTVSGAAAGTGASVAEILITGNGDSATGGTLNSSLLRTSGSVTFTATVRDSRGRTASKAVTITVTAFADVAITSKTAARCDADGTLNATGGKSVKLGCSYSYTALTGNSVTVRVYWRVYGEDAWTEITPWDSTSGYTAVALTDAAALDKRYEIRYLVTDAVSRAEQVAMITPGTVFMVWSKLHNALGLGTYPEGENQLALAAGWSLLLGQHRITPVAYNLLDNSDFRNPVNQRGASSYSGSGYTVDRWKAVDASTQMSVTAGGITSTKRLVQYLPAGMLTAGETYTVAVGLADGSIYCGSGALSTSATGVSEDGVNAYFALDGSTPYVSIYDAQGRVLKWAALYEGAYTADTLPPYIPKGYAAELAECRRYFVRDVAVCTMGTQYTSANGLVAIHIPRMRTNPTFTLRSVSSQGWGTIELSKFSNGWSSSSGSGYTMNFVYSGTADTRGNFIGVTFTMQFDASADL